MNDFMDYLSECLATIPFSSDRDFNKVLLLAELQRHPFLLRIWAWILVFCSWIDNHIGDELCVLRLS